MGEQASSKRKELTVGSKKRIKLDKDAGALWGEAGSEQEEERTQFLYDETVQPVRAESKQSTIKLLSGQEWMCSTIVKELLSSVVEMMSLVEGPEMWEEWENEQERPKERSMNKGVGYERWLWKMLDDCDATQAREEKANIRRGKRKIEQARKKMHSGRDQPSILSILKIMQERKDDPRKEESRVHAQTASMRNNVESPIQERSSMNAQTASQRNILSSHSQERSSVTAQTASQRNNLSISESNSIVKSYQKDKNASVQSINGGHPDGVKRTLSQITFSEGWKN